MRDWKEDTNMRHKKETLKGDTKIRHLKETLKGRH